MRQSVAEGEQSFEGPDVSQPYPSGNFGSMKDMEWAIRVDLATNISLEWAPDEDDNFDTSKYVSGGVLSLSPTEDEWSDELDETFYPDPSWKICVYYPVVRTMWQDSAQQGAHKKDECAKIVPDECISAMRTSLIDLLSYNSTFGEGDDDEEGCPFPDFMPDGCPSGADTYHYAWNHTVFRMESAQPNRNGTYPMLGPWNFDQDTEDEIKDSEYAPDSDERPTYSNGSAIFQWASLQGDAGNMTQLEEIGLATPLFIACAPNSTWINENAADDYTEGNAQAPHIEFVCGEATETTVDYLEEVPESAASRNGIAGWAVGLLGVGAAMMLL